MRIQNRRPHTPAAHGSSFLQKALLLALLLYLLPAAAGAQAQDLADAAPPQVEESPLVTAEEPATDSPKTRLFLLMGPAVLLNADSDGAPSPVMFTAGLGAAIPLTRWLDLAPGGLFFTNYYGWKTTAAGGRALPAEIENRTAIAPSLLLDVPVTAHVTFGNTTLSAGAGAALFLRYGFLSDGVPDSAAGDVKKINGSFYSGLNFLYPSVQLAIDRSFPDYGMTAGVLIKAYLPLAALLTNRGLDTALMTLSTRLLF